MTEFEVTYSVEVRMRVMTNDKRIIFIAEPVDVREFEPFYPDQVHVVTGSRDDPEFVRLPTEDEYLKVCRLVSRRGFRATVAAAE